MLVSPKVPQSQIAGALAQEAAWAQVGKLSLPLPYLVVRLLREVVTISNDIAELAWIVP